MDKIPGKRLVEKAEKTGNEVPVPMTGRRLGLAELLKRTAKEIQEDHLAAFAGNLTYKGLFALFPFFVFLLSLLGLFGAPDLLQTLIEQARDVLPQGAIDFLESQLLGIAGNKAQGAFTVGALVSILLALWGVSGAFRSVMEAMNVMYEIEEARPFWKQLLISIFLSLGVAALLHLGGTRVLGILVTMDAEQGVEALRIIDPRTAVPIHYNDYGVFKSPLEDFKKAVAEAGLEDRVRYLAHGETYEFEVP